MLLLQQLADECLDASSSYDDDDDSQIYANNFAELFAEPLDVPKVNGYVRNVVSNYPDKQLAGFPGVIGCIDGTYIPMRCPANKIRSTYINRHDEVYP
ncbi:hypothetical protein HPB50_023511 [Hyalomma asiaticum]|uniref:Uncharacterized protein n=1 Tax=Hyalomma asiaticum TaxID=266040 RepID=A0ACB7SDT8_HYAAI|nr:hypothetical protein HPB50_023511 [Hyalomma asiaticum]